MSYVIYDTAVRCPEEYPFMLINRGRSEWLLRLEEGVPFDDEAAAKFHMARNWTPKGAVIISLEDAQAIEIAMGL